MSFHKNALKLIGYFLNHECPILVYQSPEACDCLLDHLMKTKITWESKLSLASGIAYVLAYLHTDFQTPVIYRDRKLRNFLIDKYGTTKFANFSFCISIPLGDSQVEDDSRGTYECLDPANANTGVITEKTDVYNFGMFLIELLTCKNFTDEVLPKYWRITRDDAERKMHGYMVMEGMLGRDKEVGAIATLAFKCIGGDRGNMPEMVDVAKQLKPMLTSARSSSTS